MSSVEQKLQFVTTGDVLQFFDITWSSPQVDTDDSCCAFGYQLLHTRRINVVRRRIYVAKDRSDLLPVEGVGGRDKSERRDDDLACESSCLDRNFETHRGIAYGDAAPHFYKFGNSLLQLL